jgi:hypothetical protein
MTNRASRDTEYVVVRDRKPKKTSRYYYDDDGDVEDDDNESQLDTTTRSVVRSKPIREQHVKYVSTDDHDSQYRRQRATEPSDVCNSLLFLSGITIISNMFLFLYLA